jgi:hypothetical protein
VNTIVKSSLASLLLCIVALSFAGQVYAAARPLARAEGLLVSPATSFVSVSAGSSKTSSLLVADYTSKPISVALQVQQFNVNNYSYSYTFNNVSQNWITLSQNQINLSPNQSKNIAYKIQVPTSAKPGGYYLTLIASSVLGQGSIRNTAQVASLMYLTVNGRLSYDSALRGYGISRISFSRTINYHFDVIDTGNIYSFIYESASIHGLFGKNSTTPIAHLVMPGKVRAVSGSITAPKWPGIYKVTYGYTITGGTSHEISQIVLFVPPWFIAILLALLLLLNIYIGKKRSSKKDKKPNHS